ncbi:MAG: voltage-gated potassium channel [Pseudonocardiales bacterium]|nr:voltage-gated potassium channel [Pseudonocardiales bacterium]
MRTDGTLRARTARRIPGASEPEDPRYGPTVERWEERTEWPLAVLALLFLAAYAWPILDDSLGQPWRGVCRTVDYGTWALFGAEYLVRLSITRERLSYFFRHWWDLAIIALPVLRPLRLLRLVLLFKVLNRRFADSLRGRVVIYTAGAAGLLLFVGALAELESERHAHGTNITNFGDSLWWALTTVSTVGYGDHFPVSRDGKFVAAGLMFGGIALIGVVTASFATWLVDRVRQVDHQEQALTKRDLHAIMSRLDDLQRRLDDKAGENA